MAIFSAWQPCYGTALALLLKKGGGDSKAMQEKVRLIGPTGNITRLLAARKNIFNVQDQILGDWNIPLMPYEEAGDEIP